MEKIKLRKEIANLLQVIRDDGFSDYALIGMLYVSDKNYDPIHQLNAFMGQGSDKMHPDDLLKALVNGYEVEETPEDKIKRYILSAVGMRDSKDRHPDDSKLDHAALAGALQILEYLNIKIEGIN